MLGHSACLRVGAEPVLLPTVDVDWRACPQPVLLEQEFLVVLLKYVAKLDLEHIYQAFKEDDRTLELRSCRAFVF